LAEDADATLLVTLEDLTEFEDAIAASNKELESFMSVAGHDLRAPLRILKGFADALEDECGAVINDEGRGFLREILKASDRMDGLIEGLLTLSRAGRAEMNCESVDLSTLVELVAYELRHGKIEREVEFQCEPGINVWGDVRLMMTVLRTLLGNAWKYTSHTARPAVRCYAEERGGQRWVCVTDNGAGFDMAQVDHAPHVPAMARSRLIHLAADQLAAAGAAVSRASWTRRQSSPSKSAESCAAVSRITPSSIAGQRNRPSSRRLAKRQTPVPSQNTSLTRSARLARNT